MTPLRCFCPCKLLIFQLYISQSIKIYVAGLVLPTFDDLLLCCWMHQWRLPAASSALEVKVGYGRCDAYQFQPDRRSRTCG